MEIRNAVILTNKNTKITMTLEEMKNVTGCLVMLEENYHAWRETGRIPKTLLEWPNKQFEVLPDR